MEVLLDQKGDLVHIRYRAIAAERPGLDDGPIAVLVDVKVDKDKRTALLSSAILADTIRHFFRQELRQAGQKKEEL